MATPYASFHLPQPLVGPLQHWLKLSTVLHRPAPLLAYYSALYLVQLLIAIVTDYRAHSINVYGLSALHVAQLQSLLAEALGVLQNQRKILADDSALTITINSHPQPLQNTPDKVSLSSNGEIDAIEDQFHDSINQFEKLGASSISDDQLNSIIEDDNQDVNNETQSESFDNSQEINVDDIKSKDTDDNNEFTLIIFTAAQVLDKEILSKNYLIDQGLELIESAVQQVQTNSASKNTGLHLIRASYLLEIALKAYPVEHVESYKAETSDSNEINLDNIEDILSEQQSFNMFLTDSLLTNREISRKIKYSRLVGVKVIKMIKNNNNNFKNIDFTNDHELMISIIKLTEMFSQQEVDKVIKEALDTPSDEENTPLFPSVPDGDSNTVSQEPEELSDKDIKNEENSVSNTKSKSHPSIADFVAKQSQESSDLLPTKSQEWSVDQIISNSDILQNAIKCCHYAISALEYEDDKTAVNELEESLRLIKKFQKNKAA